MRIAGCTSTETNNTTAVPQGSILGPLLFSIFTGDLRSLNSTTIMRNNADDTSLLRISNKNQ